MRRESFQQVVDGYPSDILIKHARELGRFMRNDMLRATYYRTTGQYATLARVTKNFTDKRNRLRCIQRTLRRRFRRGEGGQGRFTLYG